VPRYESGKVYGVSRRSRAGGKRASGDHAPSKDGRKVRAGRPIGDRASSRRPASSRRRRASAARPPRRWLKAILLILIVAGLLAVGGYSTLKTLVLSQLVGVVVARDGQVEELVVGQGFVIRHELVLRSPVTGTVTLTLAEGARTRKDGEVANLSDTEEKAVAETRVAQLEADLAAFNASNAQEEATLIQTLASTQTEAATKAEVLRLACLGSDFVAIDKTSSELATAGLRGREARAGLETIRKDRAAVEAALATARTALQQSVFPILASEAGLISYCLDGAEETLTPESIGQYGTEQILRVARGEASTVDQSRVQAGAPLAKIIGDTEAYVSVIVTNGRADELSSVKDVVLRFPGFEGRRETAAELFHVGQRERNGYCLVTYRAKELLAGMISIRQTEATIVVHVWTGTVLPRKAVVRRGGQDGVFVLDVTVCRFRPVEVLGGDSDNIVVDGLSAGTQVISTPALVKEGTRIGAVEGLRLGTLAGPLGGKHLGRGPLGGGPSA